MAGGLPGLFPDDYLDGLRAEDRMAHYTFGDVRPNRPATIVAVAGSTICGFASIGPSREPNAADAGGSSPVTSRPSASTA
ncbi:MAG: hypothetical protein ACRDS0_24090, partial [Pseudonocardiaceae bacterium]